MKILAIGDIVARTGRKAIRECLPSLIREHEIDLVIANGENLTHGLGMSHDHVTDLHELGIDLFTSGDHIWDIRDTIPHLDKKTFPVIRPANYPPQVPGFGFREIKVGKNLVLVINLMGRVFIKDDYDDPFRTASEIIKKSKAKIILIDIHAECTSEKCSLGWYLDGQISALWGTHQHIPTCDERILPQGTGYITDIGMTGNFDSVIGVSPKSVIPKYLTQMPTRFEWEEGPFILNAIVLNIDERTGKALSIERVQIREKEGTKGVI